MQEKSLCATRNDASVGIVRGADHAFIQMIPGSGVIAKTTGACWIVVWTCIAYWRSGFDCPVFDCVFFAD